uniref:Homing endonuclease n=1 Tax=Mammaliicoccus phage MSShimriz1 TaxID=3230127 RepID=A0AAU8GRW0_9VIRU
MKTGYKYQVGEVVNETLRIVSQTILIVGTKRKVNRKAYEVQSLVYLDAPTYTVLESKLSNGFQDSYKAGRKVYEGNSIYSVKHIRPYLIDVEESKTVSKGNSRRKIECMCPDCGYKKNIAPYTLAKHGIMCPICSKGTSYPELFMMAYLEVKGIKYEYQKVFKDLSNRRFDFYLPEENIVIEIHGLQHYENSTNWNSYYKTRKSDKEKYDYCIKNNIKYVDIDARESSYKFIKNNINRSVLPSIVSKEKKVIIEYISSNKKYPVKEIINLYQKGFSSIEIGERYNLHYSTIVRILKKSNIILRGAKVKNKPSSKRIPVKCLNTGDIFSHAGDARAKYNLPPKSKIHECCKGKRKSAGKHPITGVPLQWEYVDQ